MNPTTMGRFSAPSRMWALFVDLGFNDPLIFERANIWGHMWATVSMVIVGFIVSTIAGVIIALIMYQSKMLRRVLEPYLAVANAVPKVAIVPLLLVIVGWNNRTILWSCILVIVFVTIISTLSAFMQTEEGKLTLMKTMGASRLQIMFKLVLPSSLPSL